MFASLASLFCECVSLAPRAPCTHRLRSVVPWFVKGLHVLTHVFSSVRFFTCCSCSGGTPHHSLPSSPRAARVEGVASRALVRRREHLVVGACASKVCIANGELYLSSGFALLGLPRSSMVVLPSPPGFVPEVIRLGCSGSSSSRRHPSQVISLSTDAIVVWLSPLRPPGCTPAEAQSLRLFAAVAAVVGCVPRGQRALLDADMLELIERSACLVEPVAVESCAPPVLVLSHAASTSSVASSRCSRMSFPRGLVEGLMLPAACMIGTFLCSVTLQRDVSPCSLMYRCMYSILGHILRVRIQRHLRNPSELTQSACAFSMAFALSVSCETTVACLVSNRLRFSFVCCTV